MTTGDIANYVSAIATVIGAAYASATYHTRKAAIVDNPSAFSQAVAKTVGNIPTWQPVALVTFLAAIAWGAVLFDQYTRSDELPDTYVEAWTAAPPVYLMNVNTKALLRFKDNFKLITLARVNFADRDPITDTVIEKSAPYTIKGDIVVIAFNTQKVLRFAPLQPNGIQLYLLLIPKVASPDSVKSLGDVERIGGKILTSRGQTVIGGPPDQPQGQPK